MSYRPNAARAVRSIFNYGPASTTVLPKPGETVYCVVLAERDLGDTAAAWTDSYVANSKGFPPPAFLKRVGSRMVWSKARGREFDFKDAAQAEKIAADCRDGRL